MQRTSSGSGKTPVDLPPQHGGVRARLTVPSSKSLTNRALLLSAAAGGGSISRALDCDDTRVLAQALVACGWPIEGHGGEVRVGARVPPAGPVRVHLGNSGTGSRFMLALAGVVPGRVTVDGAPRLRERPMGPLIDALEELGVRVESPRHRLPVTVEGGVVGGGSLRFAPRTSSQYVSALLLVAPLMTRGLVLELGGPLPSASYLALTRCVLERFGARITSGEDDRRWSVEPGGLEPTDYAVEGDWSAAAFPMAAAAVAGGSVTLTNLRPDSVQGDRLVAEALARAGCRVTWEGDVVTVSGPVSRALSADLQNAPDLFPPLAVVAACAPGGSEMTGLATLRYKESDRLREMTSGLTALGADVSCGPDWFRVDKPLPVGRGVPADVTAADDHRVAMSMAVAALRTGPLRLDDGNCVTKSYPGFWRDWSRLRGAV